MKMFAAFALVVMMSASQVAHSTVPVYTHSSYSYDAGTCEDVTTTMTLWSDGSVTFSSARTYNAVACGEIPA